MLRKLLINNGIAYGEGVYGSGLYGGFSEVKIADNWKFQKSINSQVPFTFTVIDNPDSIEIKKGLESRFLVDNVTKFAGIILKIVPYEPMPNYLYYDITCATFVKLIAKRRFGAVFENKTAGYIVNWLIDNYFYQEGITAGTIQTGPLFDKVVFNYLTGEEALNKLQTAAPGYNWHIDDNKRLHFYAKATNKSIYTIDSSFQHSGFYYHDTLEEYRNVQIIEGGLREIDLIEDYEPSPKPDGIARDFVVKHPIGREPTIYINSVAVPAADVGVNGYNTGKKWYWSYNSDKLTHDSSEAVLTDSDNILVDFYGVLPVRLKYEDNVKINERAGIDGNSGKYEEIYKNVDIKSNSAAVKYAKGLVAKYEDQGYIDLFIDHDLGDLDVNMLVKVEKPLFGIDDWFLVESISAQWQTAEFVTYKLKLLSGEFVGNWEDYLKSLLTVENEINADDIVVQYKSFSEIWLWAGTYQASIFTLLAPDIDLAPNIDLAPGTTKLNYTLYD